MRKPKNLSLQATKFWDQFKNEIVILKKHETSIVLMLDWYQIILDAKQKMTEHEVGSIEYNRSISCAKMAHVVWSDLAKSFGIIPDKKTEIKPITKNKLDKFIKGKK